MNKVLLLLASCLLASAIIENADRVISLHVTFLKTISYN